MPNRLATESSPYLLQHQNNPVDWHAWGEEALEKSKREDRPIFLSIGYSACHWCHVMEHESFENVEIAQLLNERFVCIKVDREERPDLDHIYMNAVQLMTGRGGWPMSVFLTPELQPFYGGTYWPPHDSRGMPGFNRIILAVHDAWVNRRSQAIEQAGRLTEAIRAVEVPASHGATLSPELLTAASDPLGRAFDATHGGFGQAPKFPHSMDLQLLLRLGQSSKGALRMATFTLEKMAAGGIYDHLGGGFARYSVDAEWLVPHFEKMLYDNALLALAYLEGFQATANPRFAQVLRETLDYILRDMTDATGMFYSTEDADSEGEEGKFYVWEPAEILEILGTERGTRFCTIYGVTERGNFEHGQSILHLPHPLTSHVQAGPALEQLERELAADRAALLAVRNRRIPPAKDDKVLVSWNALMIDALARSARTLQEPKYLNAARFAAESLQQHLLQPDGRLLHVWRHGTAKLAGYLDDYTYLMNAFVSLYEASFEERWIEAAVALANTVLQHFRDPSGGFFYTANDHEQLIARHQDLHDSSVPSGNSMAAYALLRLSKFLPTQQAEPFQTAAQQTLQKGLGIMQQSPTAAGQMLLAADLELGPTQEYVFVGPHNAEIEAALGRLFLPRVALAWRTAESPTSTLLDSLFEGRSAGPQGELALYICENFSCQAPLVGEVTILEKLESCTMPC